jgi:hypothetical protein
MNFSKLRSAFTALRHQKLRILIWSLVIAPLVIYLYIDIIIEDPKQHERTNRVDKAIQDISKEQPSFFSIENEYGRESSPYKSTKTPYAWMTYAPECRSVVPPVPQDRCLGMVIEGSTMDIAKQRVAQTEKALNKLNLEKPDLMLSGVTFVLTPVVRVDAYVGAMTPSGVSNHFKAGDSLIVKIGE